MFELKREELVKRLIKWGYLNKPEIIGAFRKVPREEFVRFDTKDHSYADQPLPIGFDQTISAPSMIAIMMETLGLAPGQQVLEIGAGSGYNAALVAEVVGENGKVVTIERIAELRKFAEINLKKIGYGWVKVVSGDGGCGYKGKETWDRILVTACTPKIPEPLIAQLKGGGKLGAPVGQNHMLQTWTILEKQKNEDLNVRECGGCSFVPLVGKYGWKNHG